LNRIRIALAVSALALAVPASAGAATTLKGTVGPGFTISLKSATGAKVTSLKAGTYKIVVADKSSIHNFHLKGPGVSKDSGIGKVATVTWIVTLKRGSYKYVCDPHASLMHGAFKVV